MSRHRRKSRIALPDAALTLFFVFIAGYLAVHVSTSMEYRWNWSVIPQYLFRYDEQRGTWVPNMLMQGFFTTVRLGFWATILAAVFGLAIGLLATSKSLFKRMVGRTYVELIRNTPPLVLVFIFYFFIGDQIMTALEVDSLVRSLSDESKRVVSFLFAPPARFSGFMSALVTLALYESAYIAEIVRGGLQSVEKGQWEASYALGFSWFRQMRHIILPQAFRRILPPLAGQLISTIKDSAIVSVISIQELTFQGMELMAATYLTFEIWITITTLYFVLTFACSLAVGKLEVHLRKKEV